MQFKPRNPYAVAARQRHAGAHEQSERAQRRNARQALQQALRHAGQDEQAGIDDTLDTVLLPPGNSRAR